MTVWKTTRVAATGIAAAFALALVCSADLWAHHSLSLFDSSETFKVQGRVTRVDWRNPHCFFYIAVTEPSGIAGEWKLESAPVAWLTKAGWTTESLKVGDEGTFQFISYTDRSLRYGQFRGVTKADGTVLTSGAGAAAR